MKKRLLLTLAVAGLCAACAAAAWATAPVTQTFGAATWVAGTGENGSFGLLTSSDTSGSYGGATIKNFPSAPADLTALSFDFNANESGASGGSPRLVVQFSDGGNAALRPLSLTANIWTHVDGMSGTNWDNNSGGCGYEYSVDWSSIVACHSGATITGMWVVNDSGWLYPGSALRVTLDNITVNDLVAEGPGNSK